MQPNGVTGARLKVKVGKCFPLLIFPSGIQLELGELIPEIGKAEFASRTLLFHLAGQSAPILLEVRKYVVRREAEPFSHRIRLAGDLADENGQPRPVVIFKSRNGEEYPRLQFPRANPITFPTEPQAPKPTLWVIALEVKVSEEKDGIGLDANWVLASETGESLPLSLAFPEDDGRLMMVNGARNTGVIASQRAADRFSLVRLKPAGRETSALPFGVKVSRKGSGGLRTAFGDNESYKQLKLWFDAKSPPLRWKLEALARWRTGVPRAKKGSAPTTEVK